MAKTYAWVERQCASLDSRGRKTEKWVLEQRIFYPGSSTAPRHHHKGWEDTIYDCKDAAQKWMREEEEARWSAAQREREKARIIEDELRRIEKRIRHRREVEEQRIAAERSHTWAALKERERKERAKRDQALRDAWKKYEKGWEDLTASRLDRVGFLAIPWPLRSPPMTVEQITPAEIELFLLSPLHSEGQSKKDRIRGAQLRWHPDRFRRILGTVETKDKAAVEAGAGIVARCLNDLMARETVKSRV
ncbi:hypothetical protein B0H10DRAFT_1782931 [Mycena sp. CBHHK59/15]|nr:hypothetical protein B0H10DRAFT_1782931 [Mycena sp. CBHHK59/15]